MSVAKNKYPALDKLDPSKHNKNSTNAFIKRIRDSFLDIYDKVYQLGQNVKDLTESEVILQEFKKFIETQLIPNFDEINTFASQMKLKLSGTRMKYWLMLIRKAALIIIRVTTKMRKKRNLSIRMVLSTNLIVKFISLTLLLNRMTVVVTSINGFLVLKEHLDWPIRLLTSGA